MFDQLPVHHVIRTFFEEHNHILTILDRLKDLGDKIKDDDAIRNKENIQHIHQLALKLISAEPHHQREEEVLFPAMISAGIIGPPQVMLQEHALIRNLKKQLRGKSLPGLVMNADETKSISISIQELCAMLGQHIHKENNILYPMALRQITETSEWEAMKIKCDQIGYCCFCPHVEEHAN